MLTRSLSLGIMKQGANVKQREYYEKIKTLFGSSIIQYLPLWDSSGANKAVVDISGNNRNGLTGPDWKNILGNVGLGDKNIAGANSTAVNISDDSGWVDLFSSNLASAFNNQEGTFLVWWKPLADMWNAGMFQNVLYIGANDNNHISIQRGGGVRDLYAFYHAGGIDAGTEIFYGGQTDFMTIGMTWSKSQNYMAGILNGVLYPCVNNLGVWAGALTFATIGTSLYYSAHGKFAHSVLLNRRISQLEAYDYGDLFSKAKTITILGDSIVMNLETWAKQFPSRYKTGYYKVNRRGLSGSNIVSGLPTYVSQCVNDNADIIIVAYGTNDVDTATVQTTMTTQLNILKASNPNAAIYVMGILPRSYAPDNGNVNNVRISAACTATGVTYWDTRTVPWIVPATDTDDGLHPNSEGVEKIVLKVLGLLP